MSPRSKPRHPVDIYIRVSRVAGRAGESYQSPSDQERACRALIESRGYEAGEVFKDEDRSGGTMSRPAFDEAMRRAESGESGGVAVAHLTRFGRNVRGVLEAVDRLERAGAAFLCNDPQADTTTPTGRFMLQVFAALAELELGAIKARWATARANFAARGGHAGPITPAGYDRTVLEERPNGKVVHGPLVPNDDAPAIREAFRMRARGARVREIAEMLTDRSVRFRAFEGKRLVERTDWRDSAVRSLLRNPVYTGRATVSTSDGLVKESAHEAIVSKGLFRRVEGFVTPATARGGEKRPGALLAGLIVCGTCGDPMTNDGERYRCNGRGRSHRCDRPALAARERLDEYVESHAGRYVLETIGYHEEADDPAEARRAAQQAVDKARADLADVEAAREGLSPLAYGRAVAEAEERIAAAEDALETAGEVDDPQQTWDELVASLEDVRGRRNALARLVERVVVAPGGSRWTPISERVEIVYRGES